MSENQHAKATPTLEGGGQTMDWTLIGPTPGDATNSGFAFGFERDDGSGRTDYLHIPVEEALAVAVFFISGVQRSELVKRSASERNNSGGARRSLQCSACGHELEAA